MVKLMLSAAVKLPNRLVSPRASMTARRRLATGGLSAGSGRCVTPPMRAI